MSRNLLTILFNADVGVERFGDADESRRRAGVQSFFV